MPNLEDLKYLQEQPLDRKIKITQARIIEWCLRYDWEVFVSFSAGKDSCVLADTIAQVWSSMQN